MAASCPYSWPSVVREDLIHMGSRVREPGARSVATADLGKCVCSCRRLSLTGGREVRVEVRVRLDSGYEMADCLVLPNI